MSATSFSASPHRRVLASSTSLKRKAGSNNQAIPLGPESSDRQWQIGSADTNTPFRPGSARRAKEGPRNSHSSSRSASAPNPANDPPAGPPKSTQLNMDHYLEDEMRGAIFSDPKFVSNFLSVEKEHQPLLEEVLKNIPGNTPGVLDDTITLERGLYGPILSVFRSIKQAVDTVRVAHNLGVLGTNFQDSHTNSIPGVDPDTELIKPDLVLFEDDDPAQRHWETVMMPVGVKAKRTYRKVAMKQLTRYARATFAHQIHRRHLYGIIVCKWAVTFVRFDRSGIVHSEPIDMLSNYQEFQRAFAALMMLDRRAFGYDTAFTTERTLGRLEYYVDLPAEAFLSDRGGIGEEPTTNPVDSSADTAANSARQFSAPRLPARKFKVMERLCHRKSIRGRATIVLRLREVRECAEQPVSDPSYAGPMTRQRTQSQRTEPKWVEVPAGRDYVLKLIWRDPSKPQEGQILDCLKDEYGIVQCQWFSDILRWGANCHKLGATSCNKCCDITPAQVAVQRAKNLGDLDVQVAREEDGKETEYLEVETDGCVGELYAQRMARIYGWALLTTVGRLLWTADSQRQFLEAVQDATLGYWQAVNSGVLHRDVSDGNVLIAEPGESYELCKWKLKQGTTEQEDGEQTTGNSHQLAESRKLAREAILQLGRDPRGFLSDFDLATTHSGLGSELYDQASTKKRASDFAKPTVVDGADLGPSAKRLRLEDHSPSDSLSSSPGNVEEEGSSEEFDPLPVPASGHQQHKLIDFRTGTPTFMSIRVLRVQPGTHYEHHFMDDLESFFWLIFWCVVQRIDSGSDGNGGKEPTHEVLTLLHKLDRADSEMTTVADTKVTLLRDCTADEDETPKMETLLKGCQNSWACDPAIIHVVLKLGVYFENISDRGVRYLKCTPAKDFPKFFGIISEGLKMMSSPSHHTGP